MSMELKSICRWTRLYQKRSLRMLGVVVGLCLVSLLLEVWQYLPFPWLQPDMLASSTYGNKLVTMNGFLFQVLPILLAVKILTFQFVYYRGGDGHFPGTIKTSSLGMALDNHIFVLELVVLQELAMAAEYLVLKLSSVLGHPLDLRFAFNWNIAWKTACIYLCFYLFLLGITQLFTSVVIRVSFVKSILLTVFFLTAFVLGQAFVFHKNLLSFFIVKETVPLCLFFLGGWIVCYALSLLVIGTTKIWLVPKREKKIFVFAFAYVAAMFVVLSCNFVTRQGEKQNQKSFQAKLENNHIDDFASSNRAYQQCIDQYLQNSICKSFIIKSENVKKTVGKFTPVSWKNTFDEATGEPVTYHKKGEYTIQNFGTFSLTLTQSQWNKSPYCTQKVNLTNEEVGMFLFAPDTVCSGKRLFQKTLDKTRLQCNKKTGELQAVISIEPMFCGTPLSSENLLFYSTEFHVLTGYYDDEKNTYLDDLVLIKVVSDENKGLIK